MYDSDHTNIPLDAGDKGEKKRDKSLFLTRFSDGNDDSPTLLFGDGYTHTFSVERDETGTLHLMWTRRARPEYQSPVVTLHSVLDQRR